jgi:hypothetical protein
MQNLRSFMNVLIGVIPMASKLAPTTATVSPKRPGLCLAQARTSGRLSLAAEPLISLHRQSLLRLLFFCIAAQGVFLMLTGCGGAITAGPNANSLVPKITSVSQVSPTSDGGNFNLGIDGANFTPTSTSSWGETPMATTYVSTTRLTALVPAALIAIPTTASITVSTDAGTASATVSTTGGASPEIALTVALPPPTIASLSPASATAGGVAFTLTINGSNFTSASTSSWGATPLATTYISATKLTATVPACLIAAAGSASITVTTASGTSAGTAFTIIPPRSAIASLTPTSVVAQSQSFTLAVDGSNFLPGALATVVKWNSTALTTTYVSSTEITAVVPSSLIGTAGTATITVITAGGTSSGVSFTINPQQPILTSLSPGRLTAGFGDFALSVSGTHFSSPATVNWGSTPLVTTPLGASILQAQVPASLVASVGTASVTVTTPGGTSSPLTFTIAQPQPVITSLSPASAAAGGAAFTLTVNGTNFTSTSQTRLGATWLSATYVSAAQLTVSVPASLIASAGSFGLEIYIPGVGWSPSATFTVNPAPPTITSLNPATLSAGGAGFMMTIKGTAFTPASTSKWATTALGTVYVSPTQLTAAVPASLIVEPGTGSVTVATEAGTSAPASVTINPAPPAISSLSPSLAALGGQAFKLKINGQYFTSSTTAKWGSTALATTYVSETQLTADVPARLIASAGSASISVTAATGTSAPATFTVYPAPKIIATTLPSGTAGSAYSGPINVTGGAPGYTWTVTGLPDSFSYYNTSGSTLTITGTPAASGTFTFQVSVEDVVGEIAGPVTFTLNVKAGPNGENNGRLNGSYVCLFQGFYDDDGTRWASLASFQADGKGNFSTGAYDTNSYDIGSASGTIDGNYSIGSDLSGIANLHTVLTDGAAGFRTSQWALALTAASQTAKEFRMVEVDDLGTLPSGAQGTGDCRLAAPGAFSASTISGSSFVFGIEGEDRSGNLKAAAGLFNASAGSLSGSIDVAKGGNAGVQTTAFTGKYTAPDPATGRFKIDLKAADAPAGLTVYIIDAQRMFVLDNTSNNGEEVGYMRTQQQTSYSAANVSGPFVLYMRGAEFDNNSITPSGYYAEVLAGVGDGDGNLTINQSYKNDKGVYSTGNSSSAPIALDFDSARPGRATFQSASGSIYLYLFDTGNALEMGVGSNGSVDTGWLESQPPAQRLSEAPVALATTASSASYLFGELPLFNGEKNSIVGELNLTGTGTINGAITTAGENNLSWDQAASMTISWDASAPGAGTFLVADSAQGGSSCAVITSAKFVCTPQTDPSPSVQIMEQ